MFTPTLSSWRHPFLDNFSLPAFAAEMSHFFLDYFLISQRIVGRFWKFEKFWDCHIVPSILMYNSSCEVKKSMQNLLKASQNLGTYTKIVYCLSKWRSKLYKCIKTTDLRSKLYFLTKNYTFCPKIILFDQKLYFLSENYTFWPKIILFDQKLYKSIIFGHICNTLNRNIFIRGKTNS